MFAFDKDLNTLSQKQVLHTHAGDRFFKTVEHLGRTGIYAVAVPVFLGHGLLFHRQKSYVVAGEFLVSFVAMDGITRLTKWTFGRLRPFETSSPYQFFKGGTSFYSGHVVTITTFSTVLAKNFPGQNLGIIGIHHDVPLVPIIAYSTAGLVAIQRLYGNSHWSSDVYFGALAGYGIGSLTVYLGNRIHVASVAIIPGETPIVLVNFKF